MGKNGKNGPRLIKIEIILTLAFKEDGTLTRENFILKRGHARNTHKELSDPFSDDLKRRRELLHLDLEKKEEFTVSSVEKCLSDLRIEGYIEPISGNMAHPREYRLRCGNLYDLFRTVNLIYKSERFLPTKGNDYERLRDFVSSPFFLKAFWKYIFDMVYYFELWNELFYPISRESYHRMFEDPQFFLTLPIKYRVDHTNPDADGYIKGNKNQFVDPGYPDYFRNNFPGEGPAQYEEFLRKQELQLVFWNKLFYADPNDRISGFISLLNFLMKYLGNNFNYETTKKDETDFWFNSFWYATIEEVADVVQRYLPSEHFDEKLCILDREFTNDGSHSFENFKPLIIWKKLIHLSLCDPGNEELDEWSYMVLDQNGLMGSYGHYPKYTRYEKKEGRSERKTFLTSQGHSVIYEIVESISKEVWFPVPLINFIEYFLQLPCKLSVRPSLALYSVPEIGGRMQIFDKFLKLETGKVPESERRKLLFLSKDRTILLIHRMAVGHITGIYGWGMLVPRDRVFTVPDTFSASELEEPVANNPLNPQDDSRKESSRRTG